MTFFTHNINKSIGRQSVCLEMHRLLGPYRECGLREWDVCCSVGRSGGSGVLTAGRSPRPARPAVSVQRTVPVNDRERERDRERHGSRPQRTRECQTDINCQLQDDQKFSDQWWFQSDSVLLHSLTP